MENATGEAQGGHRGVFTLESISRYRGSYQGAKRGLYNAFPGELFYYRCKYLPRFVAGLRNIHTRTFLYFFFATVLTRYTFQVYNYTERGEKMKRININLDENIYEQAKKAARKSGFNMSEYIRVAIVEKLRREAK